MIDQINIILFLVIGIILFFITLEDIKTRHISDKSLIGLFLIIMYYLIYTDIIVSKASLIIILVSLILTFSMSLFLHYLGVGGGDLKLFIILSIAYPLAIFYIIGLSGLLFFLSNIRHPERLSAFMPYIFFAYAFIIGGSLLWP